MSISEEFEAEGKVKYSQTPPDIFLYARDLHWFVCRSDAPLEPWWTQYTTRQCSATLWLGGAFAECLSSALSTHKRHGHAATATGTLPAHRHWGIFHHHNLRYVKWLNTILTHTSCVFECSQVGEDLLQGADESVMDVQEFISCIINHSKPPTPSVSTPYRQLKRHHSTQVVHKNRLYIKHAEI